MRATGPVASGAYGLKVAEAKLRIRRLDYWGGAHAAVEHMHQWSREGHARPERAASHTKRRRGT